MAIKGGDLFIDNIDAPAQIAPGDEVPISVTVANGALDIATGDPDSCSADITPCAPPGSLETEGYCVGIDIDPDWALVDFENACVQIAAIGVGTHTFSTTFAGPTTTGDHTIDISMTATGSGAQESQTLTLSVVSSDGGGGGGGTCPEGTVLRNGRCVPALFGLPRDWVIAGGATAVGLALIAMSDRDSEPR